MTNSPSKRVIISFAVAATNIVSFVLGVSLAGERSAARPETVAIPVLSPSPTRTAEAPAEPKAPAKAAAAGPARAKAAPPAPSSPASNPIAGKGMWIYEFDLINHGKVDQIVNTAVKYGLTHIYVRAGSSRSGLNTWPDVARILPAAHAKGIKVIAWYFPYLWNPVQDAQRTLNVVRGSVHGHKVDGFAADIETPAEGTWLSTKRVKQYINAVRGKAPKAFMILVPPRPNSYTIRFYPFHLVPRFDAVAPMIYWGRYDPQQTTAAAVSYLKRFGKPIAPIGQVYDMAPEGGPKGRPRPPAIRRFMNEARVRGSVGVSFWSWQHSAVWQWDAIRYFPWR